MSTILFLVIVVVVTALVFDFTNGFHDSSNAMATSVATGAFHTQKSGSSRRRAQRDRRLPVDRGLQDDLSWDVR